MKASEIKSSATSSLVVFYNQVMQHVGGCVITKFRDRATAEKRVQELFDNYTVCPECGSHEMYSGIDSHGKVIKEGEIYSCHACGWTNAPAKATKTDKSTTSHHVNHPAMKTTLKLDRTIICVTTGQEWKNAYQMWKQNPSWMTSAQQDNLTAKLYTAAKKGETMQVTVNNRTFALKSVNPVVAETKGDVYQAVIVYKLLNGEIKEIRQDVSDLVNTGGDTEVILEHFLDKSGVEEEEGFDVVVSAEVKKIA